MIVDANILIYSVDESATSHHAAKSWLTDALNGPVLLGLPWPSILAFIRISTHPRLTRHPLSGDAAWTIVDAWLSAPAAWVPQPTAQHASVLGKLIRTHGLTGNLVPDAYLAALAIEHGVALCSTDSDFARFPEVRWVNPLAPGRRGQS